MKAFPQAARRVLAAAAAVLTVTFLAAGPASAHVRVKPDTTTTGSYAALTFRVPTESDTASTTGLVLTLPQDTPFAHVSVRPVPGWRAEVTEATLPKPVTSNGTTLTQAARTVTWTAEKGQGVAPGEYQEFAISVGPLPAPGTLVLPVAQTYSDGTVVDWAEPTRAGAAEPEHPAPQFDVTPAAAGDQAGPDAPVDSGIPGTGSSTGAAAGATRGSDPVARALAAGALAVAVLGVAGLALAVRRRTVPA